MTAEELYKKEQGREAFFFNDDYGWLASLDYIAWLERKVEAWEAAYPYG